MLRAKKSIWIVLATLIFLLAVPSSALAQAVHQRGEATRGPNPKDVKIQQDVQKMLADHPSFKNVRATVEDRVVNLEGSVDGYNNKVRLFDAVKGVDDVQGIRDMVQVNTERVSDEQLLKTLADKLRYDRIDRGITFNNLTLQVHNGQVTVGGVVRSEADRDSALSIIRNTQGVTGITDNIQVAPVSTFDDDLRIRIARAIYGHPTLQKYAIDPQAPIRIVVVNGHVTLYGVVDSPLDRQVAETQARSVPGAFSVDNKIVVANSQSEKPNMPEKH